VSDSEGHTSGQGRVDLDKQLSEIERLRAEMRAKTPDQRTVTTRAVARIVEDVHLEGRIGKFTVEADEPLARGGTEKGPSPLQYLMVGTAF
jgi:predicted ATP-dependent protease